MSAAVIDPSEPFSQSPQAEPGGAGPTPASVHPGSVPHGYTVSPSGRLIDPAVTQDHKSFAIFMHLSILTWIVLGPFSILVPFVLWLIKKDQSAFLNDHGREAMNFHISITLYMLIGIVLVTICVGWPMLVATYVLSIIGGVQGSLAANRSEIYRYPACLRLIG